MAVLLVLLSHPAAHAEKAVVPGTTGWILSYDRGDESCFVYAIYKKSETLIGFMSDGGSLFLLFANDGWVIPERERFEVRFRFDGRRWHTGALASLSSNVMAMRLNALGERELRRSRGFEIYGDGGNLVGRYSLKGSSQAIEYVRKCGLIASGAGENPFGMPTVNRFDAPETNSFK